MDEKISYVTVGPVIDGGRFLARPVPLPGEEDEHSAHLAALNNHYNKELLVSFNQVLKKGEIYAVYCSTDETEYSENKLWHRGRIIQLWKKINGYLADIGDLQLRSLKKRRQKDYQAGRKTPRVLLVDEGKRAFVASKFIRKLEKKFQQFPVQNMNCQLYGLVPLTYGPSAERLVEKRTTEKWDISAKTCLSELVKGEVCIAKTHYVDSNGVFHVTLIVKKKNNVEFNVNEYFVQEEYAVFEEPQRYSDNTSDTASIDGDIYQKMFSGSVDSFPSPYNSSFDTPQNACSFDIRKDVENIQNERLRLANEELREALFLSDGKKSEIQETESNNADNCLDYSHVSQDPRYTFSKKEGYSTDSSDQMTDSTSSSKIEDTSPISRTKNGEYLRPNSDKLASSNDLLNILKGDGSKSVSFLSARLPASRSGSIQMVSPEPGTLKSILKRSPGLSSTDTETSSPETAARQRRSLRHEGFERETRERGSGDHWQQQDLQQREKRTQESSLVGSQCFDRDYRAVNEADLRELEKRVKGHKRPHKGHWASSSDDEDRKYGTDSSRRKEFGSSRDMETKLTELNSRLDYRSASDKRISVSSSGEEERQRGKTLSDSRDLLKMLGASPLSFESQQREQQSSASAARKSKDKKAIELDEVLVWGRHKPKYFTTIENLQIPIQLRSAVKGEKVFEASPLQAYLWPAISRGRDVVGIASSGRGKTIGCLIPVLTVLVESEDYADLPMGNGPCVIVLVPDWRTADETYQLCHRLVACYRGQQRAQVLYSGRGTETDQILGLVNGCEILISTIPALINMLRKEYTNLDRLCHLIFDNANILVEDFTEEIKEFMRMYAKVLSGTQRRNAPHQIIAMATEWSYGLSSMVKSYFDLPVTVVANKFEMGVFTGVKQLVEICSTSQRLEHVVEFIHSNGTENDIIIFTKSTKEAENLEKLLESQSIAVLVANEYMMPTQLKDIKLLWENSINTGKFVLVMTDAVAVRMGIRNANCVIHYEFPEGKNAFGNRLHTMLDIMKKQESKKNSEKRECLSILLITEKNELHTTGIVKLLKRGRQPVPSALESIAERAEQIKEEKKKSSDICKDLKRLGKCRDKEKCKQRHTLFADVDMPTSIPICGVVKIVILDVISATVFWGRIISHRLPSDVKNVKEYNTDSYVKLALDMQLWFAEESKRIRYQKTGHLQVGDIFVIESKQGFQRVRVKSITKKDIQLGIPLEVELFGIDSALSTTVGVEKLLVVPQQFADIPPQAIEMITCGVKPVDKSSMWTAEACTVVSKLVAGKILEGKISLGLRHTLWLDPVIEKVKLEELNAVTTSLNVGEELLKLGFAEKNTQHVTSLKKLCKDVLPCLVEKTTDAVYHPARGFEEPGSLETCYLSEEIYQEVYVSAVETPGVLYVRLTCDEELLERLEDKIEAVMAVLPKYEDETDNSAELAVGSLCVAKFTVDDRWYRGRIIAMNSSGEYHIYYVDHGDRDWWLTRERVKPAWPEILKLPLQAIECSLAYLTPTDQDWTTENGDVLWDLTRDKIFSSKVISKGPATYGGHYRHNIELYDTSQDQDININHELVALGQANGSQECIQAMFPDALWCPDNRDCQYECETIPDLCLQIYRCQSTEEKLSTARKIQNIVMISAQYLDQIMESGGLKSLCRLLSLSQHTEVQEILSVCIVYLANQDDRVSEEVRKQGGLKALCNVLEKAQRETVQEQIIWALKNLGANNRNKDAIRVYGGITTICGLLKSSSNPKVLNHLCEAVRTLCNENDQNCTQIRENSGLEALCDLLKNRDVTILEASTAALAEVAANVKNRDVLREIGGIDILASLTWNIPSEKCLENVLKTLKTITNNNQLNKDYLRNIDINSSIERIVHGQKRCGILVRRYCNDLLTRLKPIQNPIIFGEKEICVPKIEEIQEDELPPLISLEEEEEKPPGSFINSGAFYGVTFQGAFKREDIYSKIHPKTVWSQRRKAVTVSIQLRGVVKEETNIYEIRVCFNTSLHGKRYELDFELYKPIIPKDSRVEVHGGEVLIVLIKKEREAWERLLKSKEKPPYLSIDFDRWVDDLSSDGDDESDTGVSKRHRTYFDGFGQPEGQSKSKKSDSPAMFPDFETESNSEDHLSSDEDSSDDLGDLI